jgi:hypothetical protein
MPVKRPFYDEWINSPWSTAENFMPYPEYESLRMRKESNQSYKAATAALKDAKKLEKKAKKAERKARR